MKSPAVAPFLLPQADAMTVSSWVFSSSGEPVPERLIHWDPNSNFELNCEVDVDASRLLSEAGLAETSVLGLQASWRSTRTRVAGRGELVRLSTPLDPESITVSTKIMGAEAGGRVDVTLRLLLLEAGSESSALAPKWPGTILLQASERFFLEGDSARFPLTVMSFSESPLLPQGAKWFLHLDLDDLEQPASAGIRLMINSDDAEMVEAVRTDSPSPSASAWRRFITYDVARTMLEAALQNDYLLERFDSWEADSVGRALSDLIGQTFPKRSVQNVSQLRAANQVEFGLEVQRRWMGASS